MKPYAILCTFFFLLTMAIGAKADDFPYPQTGDFQGLSWVEAFDALHDKISAEYAFSDWKSIDWAALKATYGETISQAQVGNQQAAYETALKEYVLSLPDGHVAIRGGNYQATMDAEVQGSYGITLAKLDNGKVVVTYVLDGSAAAVAGVEVGAEIIRWNSTEINEHLNTLSVSGLTDSGIATDEHLVMRQCQRLGRDSVGSEAVIDYRNPAGGEVVAPVESVTLMAEDDNAALLNASYFVVQTDPSPPTITYGIRSGKYGYLRLKAILALEALANPDPGVDDLFVSVRDTFRTALEHFKANNVEGIILDLRGNIGGSDVLATELAGFFYQEIVFYERQSYFNAVTRQFEMNTLVTYTEEVGDALYIEPQSLYFDKTVIAIIDPGTISSGEGVAMGIQGVKNGYTLGFHSTNGSFGMVGGKVLMPGGITVTYPNGMSLDALGQIQLDSRNGIGGVAPDFVVPMTSENAIRFANGEDVLLEHAENMLKRLSTSNPIASIQLLLEDI